MVKRKTRKSIKVNSCHFDMRHFEIKVVQLVQVLELVFSCVISISVKTICCNFTTNDTSVTREFWLCYDLSHRILGKIAIGTVCVITHPMIVHLIGDMDVLFCETSLKRNGGVS